MITLIQMANMDRMSGAEYLASIYGTEKDKVNCSFFFKIGACRHGDKCSRTHIIPTFSQTVLLKNLYHNPVIDMRQADACTKVGMMNKDEQQYFDEFFEEIFTEVNEKYGEIEEMEVCDNIGEHMIGNVYVKFAREEDAEKCVKALDNRWFNGQAIYAELSPVTDFREACCRQYELGGCNKGAFCNFMHLKPISTELRRKLYKGRKRSPPRYHGGRDRDREMRGDRRRDFGGRGDFGGGGGRDFGGRDFGGRRRSRSPRRRF
ncbi:hypothetical protein Y032_0792g2376 [Ancylostoma ceylanicum]|nr:hypothetical protein Y032_0792g2376 [Ancylostoma ceylanicum]